MIIRWTEPAARDLTKICDYIEQHHSAASARRVALAIYEGVDSLVQFPHLGRSGRQAKTRELPIRSLPFLVIYRIRLETVEITRILHGAQNWP